MVRGLTYMQDKRKMPSELSMYRYDAFLPFTAIGHFLGLICPLLRYWALSVLLMIECGAGCWVATYTPSTSKSITLLGTYSCQSHRLWVHKPGCCPPPNRYLLCWSSIFSFPCIRYAKDETCHSLKLASDLVVMCQGDSSSIL